MRSKILNDEGLYLPEEVRTCPNHVAIDVWKNISTDKCMYTFNASKVDDMVSILRKKPKENNDEKHGIENGITFYIIFELMIMIMGNKYSKIKVTQAISVDIHFL